MLMENIRGIIQKCYSIQRGRSKYIGISECNELLNHFTADEVEIDDLILVPFYITDKITYEIYDYELNIRLIRNPNNEDLLKTKTGKDNLEEVEAEILEKLKKCYFDINPQNKDKYFQVIREYFDYIKKDISIKRRVELSFGEFLLENICFEVY